MGNTRKKSQKKDKSASTTKKAVSSKKVKEKKSESKKTADSEKEDISLYPAIEIAPIDNLTITDGELGDHANEGACTTRGKTKLEPKISIRCYLCEYETESTDASYDHMMTKHYPDGSPYKCLFSGCTFSSHELLTIISHNRKLHYPPEKKKETAAVCHICSHSFNNKSSLNAHMKLHT